MGFPACRHSQTPQKAEQFVRRIGTPEPIVDRQERFQEIYGLHAG